MSKRERFIKSLTKSGLASLLVAMVVVVSEISTNSCTVWIFGQEDMPEELIE